MASFDESRLARGAGELWKRGTEAAFLDAVRDGRLPRSVFDRWLVQDFLFVQGFTVFVSLVAARAPRDAQRVTIQGLAALNDELEGIATDTPAVRDAYRYAMACERDFFGAAMEVPGTEDRDPSG